MNSEEDENSYISNKYFTFVIIKYSYSYSLLYTKTYLSDPVRRQWYRVSANNIFNWLFAIFLDKTQPMFPMLINIQESMGMITFENETSLTDLWLRWTF